MGNHQASTSHNPSNQMSDLLLIIIINLFATNKKILYIVHLYYGEETSRNHWAYMYVQLFNNKYQNSPAFCVA